MEDHGYVQVLSSEGDTQVAIGKRWSKVGFTVVGGSCLALLVIAGASASFPALSIHSAAGPSSLFGLTALQSGQSRATGGLATLARYGISPTPMSQLALTGLASLQGGSSLRGQSMVQAKFRGVLSSMDDNTLQQVKKLSRDVASKALVKEEMPGVIEPTGFWDPLGFSTDVSDGKLLFYREVELKHGRVGMLASLGFLVGENFHPLFGGDIDVPAYVAFQQTPLETFWKAVVIAVAIPELFSVFSFAEPDDGGQGGEWWTMKTDRVPGDLGFDPLGLKPTDPEELKTMQTKELNNGRLGMLAAAGMIAQELATGQKLF